MKVFSNIADFTNALEASRIMLTSRLLGAVKECANDISKKIQLRVSSKGESPNGGSFSAYSDKYKGIKTKHGSGAYGKKIDKKNFYLTGTMWDSFGVTYCKLVGDRIITEIAFSGDNAYKTNDELGDIHSEKEGVSISAPTKKEEEDLLVRIEQELFKILDSLL